MVYGTDNKIVHFHNQPSFNKITIHQFYVPANCRKEVYADEIKLATGGVSVHLNSEQCN